MQMNSEDILLTEMSVTEGEMFMIILIWSMQSKSQRKYDGVSQWLRGREWEISI